jgi:chloride channel 2
MCRVRVHSSVAAFKKLMLNDARRLEILASACAVGVASDFGAPIGGVLFSIEVTSTYFAVRNYWRGFFASVVAAFVFRVMAVLATSDRTITLLFTTDFQKSPFEIWELPAFVVIGVVCGFLGAAFIWMHRRVVELRRQWEQSSSILQKSRYMYVVGVAVLIACATFPGGIGTQLGLNQKTEISHLFSSAPLSNRREWAHGNIFFNLIVFIFFKFLLVPLAVSLPIPAGVFVPVFVLGAAVGRLGGELMSSAFPWDDQVFDTNMTALPCSPDSEYDGIVPGGYAVVGAAALAGAVTQTISTSVIVFELTGQLHHILPVMIGVLIANMICQVRLHT